jgi:hypothetical protein
MAFVVLIFIKNWFTTLRKKGLWMEILIVDNYVCFIE